MTNGVLIHHKGNQYIVVKEELVDGDLYVTIRGEDYKVLWCYERKEKYARVYRTFFPFAVSGVTAHTIAQDLVPVVPMEAPVTELFFFDYVYTGTTEM